jgi:hypothetical protein
MANVDTQLQEIRGRNVLVNELIRGGLEVARPERDTGIDLIAFIQHAEGFLACPIQLKASVKRSFIVHRKYKSFPTMLHAFVWRLDDVPEVIAMTWMDLRAFAERYGWDTKKSWAKYNYWRVPDAKGALLAELQQFRMDTAPERWVELVRGVNTTAD